MTQEQHQAIESKIRESFPPYNWDIAFYRSMTGVDCSAVALDGANIALKELGYQSGQWKAEWSYSGVILRAEGATADGVLSDLAKLVSTRKSNQRTLPNGATLFWRECPNTGGKVYSTDSIGGGVDIWNTAIGSVDDLRAILEIEEDAAGATGATIPDNDSGLLLRLKSLLKAEFPKICASPQGNRRHVVGENGGFCVHLQYTASPENPEKTWRCTAKSASYWADMECVGYGSRPEDAVAQVKTKIRSLEMLGDVWE